MSTADPPPPRPDLRAAFDALRDDPPAPLGEAHQNGALAQAIKRLVYKTKPWRRLPPGW